MGIFGPKRLGDWKGYAYGRDPQDDPLEEEMHPEVEMQLAEEIKEQARWREEALPHVVALTCALIKAEFLPETAATRAIAVYCKLDQRLSDASVV